LGRSAQVTDFKDPTPSLPRPLTSPPFGLLRRLAENQVLQQAPKDAPPRPAPPGTARPLRPRLSHRSRRLHHRLALPPPAGALRGSPNGRGFVSCA